MIEGLNRLIIKAREDGLFSGIKFSNGKNIFIGNDPLLGDFGRPYLQTEILEHLEWIDMRTLNVMVRSNGLSLKVDSG